MRKRTGPESSRALATLTLADEPPVAPGQWHPATIERPDQFTAIFPLDSALGVKLVRNPTIGTLSLVRGPEEARFA
jgi:hypothetical protein